MAIIPEKLVVIFILMTGVVFLNGNKCFQNGFPECYTVSVSVSLFACEELIEVQV